MSLVIEGGFAVFPALARPFTVSVAELPPGDADRLRELAADERLYESPGRPPYPDARTYTVTVTSGGSDRTVTASDPLPGPLAELVDVVERHRRAG